MAGGDALMKPVQNEFTTHMNLLIRNCLSIAANSPDARDLLPALKHIVAHVQANPDHDEDAAGVFLDLLKERPGELVLGLPGAIEILEFTMHHLRWPEVQQAVSQLIQPTSDPRVSHAARRVLEAFEDVWPGGEIYDY